MRCVSCSYDYSEVDPGNASARVRTEVREACEILRGADEHRLNYRPSSEVWSPAEYAGHIRDVLIVQRERALTALVEDEPSPAPMYRQERVARGEYATLDFDEAAQQIEQSGELYARTIDLLRASDWERTIIHNFPQPASHNLLWMAAHTIHEVIHHSKDILGLISEE